jgi:hypothetical protein
MSLMRQLYLPPTFIDRLPEWLRAVLRDRYIWAMLIIALFVNLGLFAFLLLVAGQLPQFVSMHFDALGVADRIEDRSAVFTLPQIGFIVILVNFFFVAVGYRREPLAAYLLSGMAIAVQFLLWFAAVGIVRAALLI